MESRLTVHMLDYLLEHRFASKKALASRLDIWTAIRQVDTKNKPRRRIAQHYAALLRISNGVRPFFISMRW